MLSVCGKPCPPMATADASSYGRSYRAAFVPWRHEQLRRPELNCSAHLHTRLKRPHPFQFGLQARIGVHVHGLFTERACWPSSIGRIN